MTHLALHPKIDVRTAALRTSGDRRTVPPYLPTSHDGAALDLAAPRHPAAVVILAPPLGVCVWAALIYATF